MDALRLRVTLRAVLLFERLSARSFASLDLQDPDDVELLIYTLQRDATPEGSRLPFDVWKNVLKSPEVSETYYTALGKALEELGEFSIIGGSSEEAELLESPDDAPTFTEIATQLIIEGGISPDYVMDRLELWELPALLQALEGHKREGLEYTRLFTWLSMLPHLAQDAAESPEKILPFPWDEAERSAERSAVLDILRGATYTP